MEIGRRWHLLRLAARFQFELLERRILLSGGDADLTAPMLESDVAAIEVDGGSVGVDDGASDGSTGDGSMDDGSMDDGSTDDGSTDDGSTDDGTTGDGTTGDGTDDTSPTVEIMESAGTTLDVELARFTGDPSITYTANIDWGDGESSYSLEAVHLGNGVFSIREPHTYPSPGPYQIDMWVDGSDYSSATFVRAIRIGSDDIGLTFYTGNSPYAGEEQGIALGSFYDRSSTSPDDVSGYSATVDWGDGDSGPGQVIPSGLPDTFLIIGTHTYRSVDAFTASVTLTHNGKTVTASGQIQSDNRSSIELIYDGSNYDVTSLTLEGELARFKVNDPSVELTATIDWGEYESGYDEPATVVRNADGTVSVHGSHTYATSGNYYVYAALVGSDGSRDENSRNAVVGPAEIVVGTIDTDTRDRGTGGINLTYFFDRHPLADLKDYTITIDWGDGTLSPGRAEGQGNDLSILGDHTYAVTGDYYRASVTISRAGASATAFGQIEADAPIRVPLVFFTGEDFGLIDGPVSGLIETPTEKSVDVVSTPETDSATEDEEQSDSASLEMTPPPASEQLLPPSDDAAGALFKKDRLTELDSPDDNPLA